MFIAHLCAAHTASPVPVIRENVISCLHDRVAREPALGVVPLRRLVSQGAGRERIGRGVSIARRVESDATGQWTHRTIRLAVMNRVD